MRRRRLLATLACLACPLAVAAVMLWPRPTKVTRENAARLRLGMPYAQVRDILGPPGDYSTGPVIMDGQPQVTAGSSRWEQRDRMELWRSDTAEIWLRVSERGAVVKAVFTPVIRLPQGPIDNLVWRVQRQWQRWFYPRKTS